MDSARAPRARRREPRRAADGRRRTRKPLLEVFMFDFDAPIYGRRITVEFLHKLRDEERFPDLDALTRQIAHDVARHATISPREVECRQSDRCTSARP